MQIKTTGGKEILKEISKNNGAGVFNSGKQDNESNKYFLVFQTARRRSIRRRREGRWRRRRKRERRRKRRKGEGGEEGGGGGEEEQQQEEEQEQEEKEQEEEEEEQQEQEEEEELYRSVHMSRLRSMLLQLNIDKREKDDFFFNKRIQFSRPNYSFQSIL